MAWSKKKKKGLLVLAEILVSAKLGTFVSDLSFLTYFKILSCNFPGAIEQTWVNSLHVQIF